MSRRACVQLAMGCIAMPSYARAPKVWRSDFERGLADWGPLHNQWGLDNHRWLVDPAVSGQVLRVLIRKGSIDPGSMVRRGLPRSGSGFKAALVPAGSISATLRYRVRFPADFEFVRGGKLPGLYGGLGNSGGHIPDDDEGFSSRLMWRERGDGEVYAYLPSSKVYGTSLLRGAFRFTPGQWHSVAQHVWLNSAGQADGSVAIELDGRLVGRQGGLVFRQSDRLVINGVFFDCFFGGNDDSWAARADTYVDYAEFELSTPAVGGR